MKFARMEMLFLIWAVPVCFLLYLYGNKKRKKILETFSTRRGLKSIVPVRGDTRRWIKAGLALAAMTVMALALSGPQYGYKWQETQQQGVDIVIALDCSKSMLATDIKPTRLDRAKRKIYDLLGILEGDRVGLVAFAGTAFLQCPLTLDYGAFHIFLQTLTPDYLPVGGTDISAAVRTSLSAFDEKVSSEKALILITDGENTGEDDPIKAAEEAQKAGVKIFCIGVGSEGGVPVPEKEGSLKKDKSGQIVVTRLDEESLKKMAVLTGGTYVRSVAGDMDLELIYKQEIRGKMEQSALAGGRRQIWEDRYQWVLIFALIFLGVEIFLPSVGKAAAVLAFFVLISMPYDVYANAMRDGLEAYDKGEYEKALKFFIDAQLDDPDNPKILYNIGNTYYKLENYDSAAQNYSKALEKEDKELKEKLLYNLGNANFRKKKYDDAIKNYEAALQINPDDPQAKQNMEFAKQVKEQMEQQQKQECDKGEKGDKDQEKKDGQDKKKGENQDQENQDQDKKEGEDREKNGEQENQEQEEKSGEQSEQQEDQGEEQKSGENKDKAQPSPESGKEKEDEGKQSASGEEKKEEEKQMGEAKPSDEKNQPDADAAQQQMEKMLNRLKDEPGKAMIPRYRERHVEKDW